MINQVNDIAVVDFGTSWTGYDVMYEIRDENNIVVVARTNTNVQEIGYGKYMLDVSTLSLSDYFRGTILWDDGAYSKTAIEAMNIGIDESYGGEGA